MQLSKIFLVVMALAFANTAMSANYSWVYASGAYDWPGDYSYGVSADYWDKSGGPLSGGYDIKVSLSGKWGGWQPYAPSGGFNTEAYHYFTVALKPTQPNQTWKVYFTKSNSRAGISLDLTKYGATPRVGVWTTYTVPLSALGITDSSISSFAIQDTSGLASNTWYVDNIGFDSAATSAPMPVVSSKPAAVATAASVAVASVESSTPLSTTAGSTVYENGVFKWAGTYSYGMTLDNLDTTGAPASSTYDIRVQLTTKWGGWQPYAPNNSFDSTPYTKLTFSLKPTNAGQIWQIYFMKVHDVPTGKVLNIADYGPAPVAGKWATYTVPLADIGVLGTSIYKFCIQDETGLSSNTWYIDNVGFE